MVVWNGSNQVQQLQRNFSAMVMVDLDIQSKIEEIKGKLPGAIFQRKGIIIGADGKSHTFEGGNLEGIVEMTRKQLEGAGLGKDEIEKILKSVKDAVKDIKGAENKAEEGANK